MISILFIDMGYAGGSWESIRDLLNALKADHHIKKTILSGRKKDKSCGLEHKWLYYPIRGLDNTSHVPASIRLSWFINTGKFGIYFFCQIYAISRTIKRLNPSIVHVNNIQGIIGILASRLMGVPVLLHNRDCVENNWLFNLQRFVINRCVSQIISVSQASALTLKGIKKPITVLRDVVETKRISCEFIESFLEEHRIDRSALKILLLGNYSVAKGYIFTSEVAQLLSERPIIFLLAGDNSSSPTSKHKWFWNILEHTKIVLSESSRINKSWQKVPAQMYRKLGVVEKNIAISVSDILICPNVKPESLGRTIIEAGQHGKPVLATDFPSFRELIEHGENGLLLPLNKYLWADAIVDLLENSERRVCMGKCGRKKYPVDSQKKYTEMIKEVYNRMV